MTAPARRALVRNLTESGLSERRALAGVGMSASSLRYTPAPDPNGALRARIIALAHRHRRYGAGMIYLKLRQEGHQVNHKRVERLYTDAQLQVRRRRRKKVPVAERHPLGRPAAPNEVWSADFVFDRTAEGRAVKCLTIVDDATTEAVAIVPARALGGVPVTRALDHLADERGLPRILRTACYEQVVKALGAVGSSNRGTDTGSGSVEPAHRASSGLIPEERRVPGGSTSSCLRREELRTTVGMASSPVGAGASGFYAAIDSSLHTWSASNAVRFLTTANASCSSLVMQAPIACIGGKGRVTRCVRRS